MSKTTWIAALVVLVTFLFGVAVGVFGAHMAILMHRDRLGNLAASAIVRRLDHSLDLTRVQRKKVEEIVDRHHARINSIWTSVRPRVGDEIDAANAEIERILTPAQRRKFGRLRLHLGALRREDRVQTESTR